MGTITTAMPTSAKQEFLQGAHCFNATKTFTATMGSGSANMTSVSSFAGLTVGMAITGTNIPAGTVLASITSATTGVLSAAASGVITAGTLTATADVFKMALIKFGPTGTYGAANVNYTDITGATDEASGTGYSAGGTTLTNVTPSVVSNVAIATFSPNPSWAGVTVDVAGCMIYNSTARLGGTSGTNTTGAGRAVYLGDFGGEQRVTSGSLVVNLPTPDNVSGLLRLS